MQWLININLSAFIWWLDVLFVLALVYLMLAMSSDRRTLLMVRGFIILLIVNGLSIRWEFKLLSFVLDKLLVGAALAMAVIFQSEFRRFLEQLGRGDILLLLRPVRNRRSYSISSTIIDELIDAVVELSQNRTGALMILETSEPIEERDFPVPGVRINAELSKEL
ncbi:MAG: TIGR00159 family protein, partial [Pseudanabaena sp. SU_2_4]|nr:TIGR00159 family protein [Pseudanabaena sp. SU_2_4]